MSVYFARVGEYIKIGYSHDPIARATTVTRNAKRPLDIPFNAHVDLVGWIPGDVWRERELHVQHLEHRVRGEWFRLKRECAEEVIWADPSGVSLERMTALSVLALIRNPKLTRDQIEAAGIQVAATPESALDLSRVRRAS